MKSCSRCKNNKSAEDFYRNSSSKDGLSHWCKLCTKETLASRKKALKLRTPQEIKLSGIKLHPDGLKNCSQCGTDRPLVDFCKSSDRADGLNYICRQCSLSNRVRSGAKSKGSYSKRRDRSPLEVEFDRLRLRPNGNKVCEECRELKLLQKFHNHKGNPDGLMRICKECNNSKSSYRRKSSREQIVSALVEIYGDACLFPGCEETENLHIDHITPRSEGGFDSMSNYQLLCAFHNISKGASFADYRRIDDD